MDDNNKNNGFQERVLYKDVNGNVKVDVFIVNEDLWLTQEKLALLFDVNRSVSTKQGQSDCGYSSPYESRKRPCLPISGNNEIAQYSDHKVL